MTILRPLPPLLSRPLSFAIVGAWAIQMGILVHHSYLRTVPVTLAADLARYGSAAQWKGIYYHGEKIGFTVGQVVHRPHGYEMQEDGQLQLTLMGMTVAPSEISTRVRVDEAFNLESFRFKLDPGTGAVTVSGELHGKRLDLTVETPTGTRHETRELKEKPLLALNLSRRLAAEGLAPGKRLEVSVFDPATLTNGPMVLEVGDRELVRVAGRPMPAFRVESHFAGVSSTSWVTDVGEVVKEESAMGLVVLRESRDRATAMAVPGDVRSDMIQAAAVVPKTRRPIDEPSRVRDIKLRIEGPDLSGPDLQGAGQTVTGDVVEIHHLLEPRPLPADPAADRYLGSEPFIESDAPAIQDAARKAVAGVAGPRARAERLVRYVNNLIDKKPTVSLPSALEVLRTRVGDCNEHTVLYVAMARALGIPSRVAVGLVYLRGAFYYHAWPEVYIRVPDGRGYWLPVDPTLDQFPADATHVRLARGGIDRQAAILPTIGRTRIEVVDLEMEEHATPILVGEAAPPSGAPRLRVPPPRETRPGCWTR